MTRSRDVGDLALGDVAAGQRRAPSPTTTYESRAGRDVEHRDEDPEVEEAPSRGRWSSTSTSIAAAQITSSGPEVLQPALREHLALLAQVAGEEDDQEDLRELARLELKPPDVHPEPRAVDGRADPGQARQEEQRDRADAEQVLVRLEHAVVAAEADQRGRESRRRRSRSRAPA